MKIAILGASGAIGAWLTDKLLKNKLSPRIITRGSLGVRLARYNNLDTISADFNNPESITKALKDCDVVINCVVDKDARKNDNQKIKSNINITKNIIAAALQNNVKRIIHLSSIVVLPPRITQQVINNPFQYSLEKDWYTQAKIESEKIILNSRNKLEACIIRPAIVYGPLIPWSTIAFNQCKKSIICLPEEVPALCYAIHIDDLSRLIFALATTNNNLPTLLYGANPEKISWCDFYNEHGIASGIASEIRRYPISEIKLHIPQVRRNSLIKKTIGWLMFSPLTDYLVKYESIVNVGMKLMSKLNLQTPSIQSQTKIADARIKELLWPTDFEFQIYNSNGEFRPEHNGLSFGFKYKISIKDGCINAAQWWNYELDEPNIVGIKNYLNQ